MLGPELPEPHNRAGVLPGVAAVDRLEYPAEIARFVVPAVVDPVDLSLFVLRDSKVLGDPLCRVPWRLKSELDPPAAVVVILD